MTTYLPERIDSDVDADVHVDVEPAGAPEVAPHGNDQRPPSTADLQAADLEPVDERETARTLWRDRASAGVELSGRELGAEFGRSERWGRDRIAEVRPGGKQRTRAARRVSGRGKARAAARHTDHGTQDGNQGQDGSAQNVVSGTDDAVQPAAQPDATASPSASGMPVAAVPVPRAAKLVAWCGFAFGTVISVAANVLYSWLPTMAGKAPAPGWAPQIGAAVWPIALVLSVEALSRVRWPNGLGWQFARYGGAGLVAVGAAVISYGHLHGVLAAWDYGTVGAGVGPLVVDGLMTISGFALLALSGNGNGTGSGRAAIQ